MLRAALRAALKEATGVRSYWKPPMQRWKGRLQGIGKTQREDLRVSGALLLLLKYWFAQLSIGKGTLMPA